MSLSVIRERLYTCGLVKLGLVIVGGSKGGSDPMGA
jgi:hypothetical protein